MKIRIYETDFEGNPIDCTGEFYSGTTALDVIDNMKLNPFQSHLTPHEFIGQILATIGNKDFSLPEDPAKAAQTFLQRLTALGYAEFSIDEGEFDTQHGYVTSPVDNEKYMQNKP